MRYVITSIIETKYGGGCEMKDGNEEKEKPEIEEKTSGVLQQKSDSSDSLSNKHRSEARSDRHGMFHHVKVEHRGIRQVTNVNVHIEPEDDCMTKCCMGFWSGIRSSR